MFVFVVVWIDNTPREWRLSRSPELTGLVLSSPKRRFNCGLFHAPGALYVMTERNFPNSCIESTSMFSFQTIFLLCLRTNRSLKLNHSCLQQSEDPISLPCTLCSSLLDEVPAGLLRRIDPSACSCRIWYTGKFQSCQLCQHSVPSPSVSSAVHHHYFLSSSSPLMDYSNVSFQLLINTPYCLFCIASTVFSCREIANLFIWHTSLADIFTYFSLATHVFTASSTALDRSPFFPPNLSIVLNLSFFSSSSGSSTLIRPIWITNSIYCTWFARVSICSSRQNSIFQVLLSFQLLLCIQVEFAYQSTVVCDYPRIRLCMYKKVTGSLRRDNCVWTFREWSITRNSVQRDNSILVVFQKELHQTLSSCSPRDTRNQQIWLKPTIKK